MHVHPRSTDYFIDDYNLFSKVIEHMFISLSDSIDISDSVDISDSITLPTANNLILALLLGGGPICREM